MADAGGAVGRLFERKSRRSMSSMKKAESD